MFLLSGSLASIPAAAVVTPIDVIKTRLQVKPVEGQVTYSGILNATSQIWQQEGAGTFFRGTLARVTRSSMAFAFTICLYEKFQRWFPLELENT